MIQNVLILAQMQAFNTTLSTQRKGVKNAKI